MSDDKIRLKDESSESNRRCNEDQVRDSEREQRFIEFNAAQHPGEHLQSVTYGVLRGAPHVVADADVHFLDPQLGVCCVHEHLAVDRARLS